MDATFSEEHLLILAKQHLGLLPTATSAAVPKFYLDELKTHVMLYPHDTNFRVMLEPTRGFGRVACLELGCHGTTIPLVQRVKIPDGGKMDGLGSLSAYRHHIENHPTHANSRVARIRAVAAANSGTAHIFHAQASPSAHIPMANKTPHVIDLLNSDSPFGSSQPTSPALPMSFASASTSDDLHNKHWPTRPAPRSRPAPSLARVPTTSLIKTEPVESVIPRKRSSGTLFVPKVEDNEVLPFEHRYADPNASSSTKLKTEPTKTPLAQVDRNAGVPGTAVTPSRSVESIDEKLQFVQAQISVAKDALDHLAGKPRKTPMDQIKTEKFTRSLENLRELKNQYKAAQVSPVKSAPSKRHPVKAETSEIKPPVLHRPSAFAGKPAVSTVASGSNVRLPESASSGRYQDSDEDDYANEEARVARVMQRIDAAQAIPAIVPLAGLDHHDENGDFHGRGRDLFVGPQAKADDIDKFLIEAGNSEQFDGNERVDKALEKLGLTAQYQTLPGMQVALMPHQTIGVAWMIDREASSMNGGCLGDDMGLGKTVQMIALIMKNQSMDPMCKTSLIVAPTALLDQWKLEIEMKTNDRLKCLVYHGPSKPRKKKELLEYDVVLTTYATMSLEWPDLEAEQKKKEKARSRKKRLDNFIISDSDSDNDDSSLRKKRKKESGLLFQIDWYRIILDEAQAIRNRRTRTSRSVTDLRTRFRWCLTGTPIINGLVDVYGYLRFLKIRPWYDFTEFHGHIGKLEKRNPQLAVTRLQAIIATFALRRMKNSMLDGKRLIELPEKDISLVKLEFSEEERDIYKMVEARTQANFNRYLRAGTVLKNYSQVLVLLLRLRQICSHPSLIQEDGKAFTVHDDVDVKPVISDDLSRARRLVSPEFVAKMKAKLKASTLQRIEAEKESADAAVGDDEECPVCYDVFTDAVVTPCTHIFCRECLLNVLNSPLGEDLNEGGKYSANERPCPSCRSVISADKIFSRSAFEPSDADLSPSNEKPQVINIDDSDEEMSDVRNIFTPDGKGRAKKPKSKSKSKPKRPAGRFQVLDSDDIELDSDCESNSDDSTDMSDFIVQSDEDEEEKDARRKLKKRLGKKRDVIVISDDESEDDGLGDTQVIFGAKKKMSVSMADIKPMSRFLPSTKMKYMMDCLRKLATERPDEKTLVVSQWTGCLALVSDYLTEAGILHVKYQGDMNRSKRDQAVRVFMSKDKARVMLMSLKCGGVGLNLTRGNNVISLDLGWSQAVEAQAFDRVHRLGQTRRVAIQRLVIADTVEDRVLGMQERKQNLADGSLGEGNGKKIGRLTVRELANLFGLDHRGRVLAQG